MGDFLEKFRQARSEMDSGSLSRDISFQGDPFEGQVSVPEYEDPEEQAIMNSRLKTGGTLVEAFSLAKKQQEIDALRLKRQTESRAKENLANRSEFTRGLLRGVDTLQATYEGGLGMYNAAMGDQAAANQRFANYQEQMRQAQENPATVTDFFSTDPKTGAFASPGNFGTYVAGTLGQAVPSLTEAVASGIAGAAIGAAIVPAPDPTDVVTIPAGAIGGFLGRNAMKRAIASAAQQYAQRGVAKEAAEQMADKYVRQAVANRIATNVGSGLAVSQTTAFHEGGGMYAEGLEKGYNAPGSAIALGQVSGFSEALLGSAPTAVKAIMGKAAVNEVARDFGWRTAAGYAWDVAKGAAEEGVQEGFQEFLGDVNKEINDPNFKINSRENFMQWAEAAAAGAVTGGVVSGGSTGIQAIRDRRRQLEQIQAKGFVSESDAKQAGIEGTSRRERMANLEAEREELSNLEAEASRQSDMNFAGRQGAEGEQFDEAGQFVPQVSQEDLDREFAARMAAQGGNVTANVSQAPTGEGGTWSGMAAYIIQTLSSQASGQILDPASYSDLNNKIKNVQFLAEQATRGDTGAQVRLMREYQKIRQPQTSIPPPPTPPGTPPLPPGVPPQPSAPAFPSEAVNPFDQQAQPAPGGSQRQLNPFEVPVTQSVQAVPVQQPTDSVSVRGFEAYGQQPGGPSSVNPFEFGAEQQTEIPQPTQIDSQAAIESDRKFAEQQVVEQPTPPPLTPEQQAESDRQFAEQQAAQIETPEVVASKPEPEVKKGKKPQPQEIGVNSQGQTVFEDENGVRSVLEGDIRTTEKVFLRPTRDRGVVPVVDLSAREDRFKIASEMPATEVAKPVSPAAATPEETTEQDQQPEGGVKEPETGTPAPKELLGDFNNIEELYWKLENWSADDKRPKESYTTKELLDMAQDRLEDFAPGSYYEISEELAGEHGPELQKEARKQVQQIKAWIKKAERNLALQAPKASKSKLPVESSSSEIDAMMENIMGKMGDLSVSEQKEPPRKGRKKPTEKRGRKSDKTKAKAADKREQAKQAMLDAFKDSQGKLPSGLDIEIATKVAKAAKLYIEAGALEFKAFIENLVEDFGDAWVRDKKAYLESAWRTANKLKWVDSPAGSVDEVLQDVKPVAEKAESPAKEQVVVEKESETDKTLRQAGLKVEQLADGTWQITGNTYEHSKEIGDVKREIRELGGYWDKYGKRWTFKADPRRAIADRLFSKGVGKEPGDAGVSDEQMARERARREQDEKADVQATRDTYVASVDQSTRDLIGRGLKFGMTDEVVNNQIEDIGRVVNAAENGRPMFIIGSAPGTGKTFVLGGAIRELRRRGFKRFVYVTQNEDLVSQVQKNLADYGLEGVEFVTYSKARTNPPRTNGAVLLLDEAHTAKNLGRETGKKMASMVKNSIFTVYATATPFENVTEAEYIGYSGIFDDLKVQFSRPSSKPGGKPFRNELYGFKAWAWMFGANVYFVKQEGRSGEMLFVPVVWWDKQQTSEEDQLAANEWLKKRGVYVQRPMDLPVGVLNSERIAVEADPYWAEISNKVVEIYAEAESEAENNVELGQIKAHKANVLKRLLEASKVDAAIANAKEIIGEGKVSDPQVIIFVNTKADTDIGTYTLSEPYRKRYGIKGKDANRRYTPSEMDEMMQRWYEAKAVAKQMGDDAGPPPFAPFVHKIAMAMDAAGVMEKFPSVIDKIMDAFPGQAVEYSGRTASQNSGNLAKWKNNEAKLIVATMDKGGTGLSFHDTTGKMPSRYQVNMNLPWSGTKVEQVSGRLARYGTAKPVNIKWLFASNIPFDRELSKTVGSRMRSMAAAVQGRKSGEAKQIRDFDFEESQIQEMASEISPWSGATVEDEDRWAGTTVVVSPKGKEEGYEGVVIRVLNKGDAIEIQRTGFDASTRVPAERVEIVSLVDKQPESTRQSDKAAKILADMESNQSKLRQEKKQREGEKLANWVKAFEGSPREITSAKDLFRKDFEKARENGVSDERLIEIIDHGMANEIFTEEEASDLKKRISPESQQGSERHELLLNRAAPYSEKGESYKRDIAEPAMRLQLAIAKGNPIDGTLVKSLVDELETRLDYWEPILSKAKEREQDEQETKDVEEEQIDGRPEEGDGRAKKDKERAGRIVGSKTRVGQRAAHYEAVEIDDLIGSHYPFGMGINEQFPEEWQKYQRRYESLSDAQKREVWMPKGGFDPSQVIDTTRWHDRGPTMTVEKDGKLYVVGGTRRYMMLANLYRSFPDKAIDYHNALVAEADMFGLDVAAVNGMDKPILIRVIDEPGSDIPRLVDELNAEPQFQKDPAAEAASLGRGVGSNTIAVLRGIGDEETLAKFLDRKGVEVVYAMVADNPELKTKTPNWVKENSLTKDAKLAIQKAIMGAVISDATLINQASPRILQSVNGALAEILLLNQKGGEWGLSERIKEAITYDAEFRLKGKAATDQNIKYWMNDPQMTFLEEFKKDPNSDGYRLWRYLLEFGGARKFRNALQNTMLKEARLDDTSGGLFADFEESMTGNEAFDLLVKGGGDADGDLRGKLQNPPDVFFQEEPDIDATMRSRVLDLGIAANKAGITQFDDFIAYAVRTVGENETRRLGNYLTMVGKTVGMTGVRPTKDVLGVPLTKEQYVELAKQTFASVPAEQVEAGIEVASLVGVPQMAAGFAPAGSPIPKQGLTQRSVKTDTLAFKKWFGDSKVVDENGDPLVVYHGATKPFLEFVQDVSSKLPSKLIGHFFSPSAEMAGDHAIRRSLKRGEYGASVYPVYLSIKNPYVESTMDYMDMNTWSASKIKKWKQSLINDGYDGIYIKPLRSMPGYESGVWVAFEPTQIKSATANVGTFDPSNPNMLMQDDFSALDADLIPKAVLDKMSRRLNAMGYDSRGAEDVRKAIKEKRLLSFQEDWIAAYQFAIGVEKERKNKAKTKKDLKHVNWSRLSQLGETLNPNEAGYIKPDGNLADFSGKREGGDPGTRSLDHREAGGTAGMQEVIAYGWVRMDENSGSLDIAKMPTPAQMSAITRMAQRKFGEIVLDLEDGLGEWREVDEYYSTPPRRWSQEYPEGTKPQRIINDIKKFFGGDTPNTLFQGQENAPLWYFKSRKLIQEKMGSRATSEQVLGMLRKNGVSEEELYWSGLEELLGSKQSVTKDEVLAAIDNAVRVEEIEKSDDSTWVVHNGEYDEYFETKSDAIAYAKEIGAPSEYVWQEEKAGGARYSQYATPGGERYKELLITLPQTVGKQDSRLIAAQAVNRKLIEKYGGLSEAFDKWTPSEQAEFDSIHGEARKAPPTLASETFLSSHWDESNVLAHIRMNERTDADGKRVLFIEEIQSDWHQEGRRKGYKRDAKDSLPTGFSVKNIGSNWWVEDADGKMVNPYRRPSREEAIGEAINGRSTAETLAANVEAGKSGVPDAPFKKTWPMLAMKRAIQYAAENGFDRIAWTTGEQQAERYDLSKQVDRISYAQANGNLIIDGKRDSHWFQNFYVEAKVKDGVIIEYNATSGLDMVGKSLEEVVGKEIADKLLNGTSNNQGYVDIQGEGLKVGGEGMRAFYDRMLPNETNKLIKRFGAKVGQTTLKNLTAGGGRKVGGSIQNSFDITPAMRESALQNGQSLFQTQSQDGNVKGWTQFISGTRALIGATRKADISTVIHEYAHVIRRFLLDKSVPQDKREGITDEEIAMLEEKCGVKDGNWSVESEEKLARMWEQYWFEGKSPNAVLDSLFAKISRWMQQVYKGVQQITGQPLDPEVRKLFDKLVQRTMASEERAAGVATSGGRGASTVTPRDTGGAWKQYLTSIANEVANMIRMRLGVPGLTEPVGETFEQWIEEATQQMSQDPSLANRLVKELGTSTRNISDIEVAILQIHFRHLNNLLEEASDRLFKAKDAKDSVAAAKAQLDTDLLVNEIQEFTDITKKAGTEAGRALVARKIALQSDFTLGSLLRKARIANAGESLDREQVAEITALSRQIEDLEDKLAKEVQKNDDLERKLAVEKSIEDDKKQAGKPVRNTATNRAVKSVEKFVSKFASIFGKKDDTTTLQQTEDEQMAEEGKEVIKSFVDAGVYSFGEFMAKFKAVIKGEIPVSARVALRKAWDEMKMQGEIPAPEMTDERQAGELRRLARMVQRELVEFGITDPEEVIDGVHEALREAFEDVTRREAMDAMSGYGQYSSLSDSPNDKIIRDLNGQYQQMAKLDDMRQGMAPKKTGGERRTPSDKERELIQEVNQMKRESKYFVTDPESQLKTIFQATRTALRNRIYDLSRAINVTGKPIPGRSEVVFSGEEAKEIADLRKQRDELMAEYKRTFPKPKATFEQRAAAAERAADRAIAELEREIASGKLKERSQPESVSTPALQAKLARIDALKAARDAAMEMQLKQRKEERDEKAYVANLLNRIADYEDRIQRGYFGPKPKKEPRALSPKEKELMMQLKDKKDEFFRYAAEYRLKNMTPAEKALDYTKELMHLSRAIMTSFDLSAVFRQGGISSLSHPRLAAASAKEMYYALRDAQNEFDTMEKIENDPLYAMAMQAGLPITVDDGSIQRQEEAYMGRWAKWGIGKKGTKINTATKKALTPVSMSARAYTTYLNTQRFLLFKHMVSNLGVGGQVTPDEAKVIATYVAAATGRADLGKFNQAMANLNTVFFAPRYVASRFQYLALPFYILPSSKVSGRVKKMIAMEYARFAVGLTSFLGLSVLLGSMLTDDEEEKPTVELDPRSSDWMKLKIGETRIDPMAGLSQTVTLLGQLATGQKKGLRGDIQDLYGEKRKFGDPDLWDVTTGFLRKKLAPIPGAIVDLRVGENVIGEKETPLTAAKDLFIPLSFQEAGETFQARGLIGGAGVVALSLLGMGGGTYGPRTAYATGDSKKREELFNKDLDRVKWDSPDPAYKDFLTAEQLDKFNKQRERRKQSLAYAASADPKRKEYASDETFKQSIAERDKAIEAIVKSGMGYEEAKQLLIAYYKRNYGSAYETRGGIYQMKESLANRLRAIRRKLTEKQPAKI